MTAAYWSVTTMATVGYGDVHATNVVEICVSIAVMISGVSVFAYFTGSIASLLAALSAENAHIAKFKTALEEFIRKRKISRDIADRVRRYYMFVISQDKQLQEKDII